MAWLFQAIPKRYDLRTELKLRKTETWLVTRYRDEMRKGDLVYFWMAGNENIRGLYGWGRITSSSIEYYSAWGYGVDVRYEGVFERHIPVSEVRTLPEMADHVLLKMPIGTNFRLTPAQDHALRRLIVRSLGKEVTPNG